MSNIYAFTYPQVTHFQIPHEIDRWLTSIKLEELRLLLLVHSKCEWSSRNEVTLSNDEICEQTGIHRSAIARARRALIDYGLLAVREHKRQYTYIVVNPVSGVPAPDRRTIGTVDLKNISSDVLSKYALFILENAFPVKDGVQGACPLPDHNDSTASLFICTVEETSKNKAKGVWSCHGCNESGNIYALAKIVAADKGEMITEIEAFRRVNKTLRKFDPAYTKRLKDRASNDIVYSFVDEDGVELFQEARLFGIKKKTVVRRMDPHNPGRFTKGRGDVRNVLFNLPDILQADVVFIVEGPKDATNLNRFDLKDANGKKVAVTTNLSGAGNFTEEHADSLVGKKCILLGDTDTRGKEHMQDVKAKLDARGIVSKTVELPAHYSDVSDFLAANHEGRLIGLEGGEWLDAEDIAVEI
jgi:hypothetical protein